jgi:hypothetical protein
LAIEHSSLTTVVYPAATLAAKMAIVAFLYWRRFLLRRKES